MCINDQPWFVVFQWIESLASEIRKKPHFRPQVPPPHLGDVTLPDESNSEILMLIAEEPEKHIGIWGWVKTLYPCSSHQNSWDLWMFIPLKMVCIGIDP